MLRTDILDVVVDLCARHRPRGFIVPVNTGTTARAVRHRFGPDYHYIAVGNPASSHAKGYVHHAGVDATTRDALMDLGFDVVLQEVSVFQPMGSSPVCADHAVRMQASYARGRGGGTVDVRGTTLSWIVEATIRALFDEQVKTCVELALMAGESEGADGSAKYVSLCMPSRWSDQRDCAVVLTPSTPATFFEHPPHIYEIAYSDAPRDHLP